MKPKKAIVPRWVSPEKKKAQWQIRRLEWMLKNSNMCRYVRERTEAQLEELKSQTK